MLRAPFKRQSVQDEKTQRTSTDLWRFEFIKVSIKQEDRQQDFAWITQAVEVCWLQPGRDWSTAVHAIETAWPLVCTRLVAIYSDDKTKLKQSSPTGMQP